MDVLHFNRFTNLETSNPTRRAQNCKTTLYPRTGVMRLMTVIMSRALLLLKVPPQFKRHLAGGIPREITGQLLSIHFADSPTPPKKLHPYLNACCGPTRDGTGREVWWLLITTLFNKPHGPKAHIAALPGHTQKTINNKKLIATKCSRKARAHLNNTARKIYLVNHS